jgi:F0F1-type ATP synthase membrane subunit b/b'
MEEARQTAEAARAALLDAARKQAADKTATAVAQLTDETAAARDRLQRESTDLAHLVAERVLGRPTA